MAKTKLRKTALGTNVVTSATSATQEVVETKYEQAVWWKSLAAYAIDVAIYVLISGIFLTSMQLYAIEGDTALSVFMMISLLIATVYLYAVMPKFVKGQTVGRWIVRIRLDATKKPMSYWRYFLREFMAKISMLVLLVPMTLVYGAVQWISKKERPSRIMLDELFNTETVDLTKPIK